MNKSTIKAIAIGAVAAGIGTVIVAPMVARLWSRVNAGG